MKLKGFSVLSKLVLIITVGINASSFYSALNDKIFPTLSLYLNQIRYNTRSAVFIFRKTEECGDLLLELHKSDLQTYNINVDEGKINEIYFNNHQIYYDNSKIYLIYQANLRPKPIEKLLSLVQSLPFWKNRDKVLILTNTTLINKEALLLSLFNFCFKIWLMNIAILPLQGIPRSYMFNPFKNMIIDGAVDDLFKNHLMRNLYGFQINISMFSDPVGARKRGESYIGSDGIMSKTIMEAINATYKYLTPDDGDTYGDTDVTYVSGSVKDIVTNRAQVNFNSRLLKSSLNRQVEFTSPHDRDDLVVLVPKSTDPKNLTEIIPPLIWQILAIVSLILLLYLYIAKDENYDIVDIFLILILIVTGRPFKELYVRYFRVFYMSSMVLIFFLNTIFCCKLTSFWSAPEFSREVDTLEELAQSKYTIITVERFKLKLNAFLSENVKEGIMSKIKIISMSEQKNEILKCENRVVICKNGMADLALYEGAKVCYKKMKETVLPALASYILHYGSPLFNTFNDKISKITEAGLQNSWKPHITKVNSEENYRQISLKFIYVSLEVYTAGVILACTFFFCEVIYYKIYNNK